MAMSAPRVSARSEDQLRTAIGGHAPIELAEFSKRQNTLFSSAAESASASNLAANDQSGVQASEPCHTLTANALDQRATACFARVVQQVGKHRCGT
jgi:hypothetical protein